MVTALSGVWFNGMLPMMACVLGSTLPMLVLASLLGGATLLLVGSGLDGRRATGVRRRALRCAWTRTRPLAARAAGPQRAGYPRPRLVVPAS